MTDNKSRRDERDDPAVEVVEPAPCSLLHSSRYSPLR